MKIKTFNFFVSDCAGHEKSVLSPRYSDWVREITPQKTIDNTINKYINEEVAKGHSFHELKINHFTVLNHNNGGSNIVNAVYTVITL